MSVIVNLIEDPRRYTADVWSIAAIPALSKQRGPPFERPAKITKMR